MRQKNIDISKEDVAASFQQSVIEVLVEKAIMAAKENNTKTLALAGGVAANEGLRSLMFKRCGDEGIELKYPSKVLCTDNAAMIGSVAYYNYVQGKISDLTLNAVPNLKLE